jgi:LacI family transcriptional regulator
MKKQISSTDVAEEAGVSRATVSYVLNNVDTVKITSETREKVLDAAKKLGYHPNSIARALKTQKSMSIGIVSKRDIAEDRLSKILRGIREILKQHQYSITVCSEEKDESGKSEFINYYLSRRIDGVIIISAEEGINLDLVDLLLDYDIPCVLVDYHVKDERINCIDINYYHGAYSATNYLIEKGYEKIIYLAPDIDIPQEQERLQGVTEAVNDSSSKVKNFKFIKTGQNQKKFNKDIVSTLKKRGNFEALIVSWIYMGYKTLYEANRLNIKIPEQLAVMSLAGSSFADLSYPRLSTCDLPLYKIGIKSAKILLDSMENEIKPVNTEVVCSLNPRDST